VGVSGSGQGKLSIRYRARRHSRFFTSQSSALYTGKPEMGSRFSKSVTKLAFALSPLFGLDRTASSHVQFHLSRHHVIGHPARTATLPLSDSTHTLSPSGIPLASASFGWIRTCGLG